MLNIMNRNRGRDMLITPPAQGKNKKGNSIKPIIEASKPIWLNIPVIIKVTAVNSVRNSRKKTNNK